MLKLLLVDDHTMVREGMQYVLRQLAPEVSVLQAANWADAIRQVEAEPDLDLILLDLGLPDISGFSALSILREKYPAIPVAVVSGSKRRKDINEALQHGALGFIPKAENSQTLLAALKFILSGQVYVPRTVLFDEEEETPEPALPVQSLRIARADDFGLTQKQFEVLQLLLAGECNKIIARKLDIAEGTVKIHISTIFRVLGVATRLQAAVAAKRILEQKGLALESPQLSKA